MEIIEHVNELIRSGKYRLTLHAEVERDAEQGQPIHAVCSIYEGTLVIITLYRPDSELWINWKIRKEGK